MPYLKIFTICLIICFSNSGYLTPEHTEQHIKRLISDTYQLYVINLGKTQNQNPLKAYVISGIKKQQSQIKQLTQYPATLITSYMHPRQPYSYKLIQKVLDDVLNNYNTDYYFKYMLDHTLLILFPFVNIDGYYRYQKMIQDKTDRGVIEKYRKNMKKYGKCQHQWEFGVDINRNFDSSFGSLQTSQNQCGEQYRGPQPFSQKQSKAIKILFNKFKITLAIDIHSYGNQWIYPYASQTTNQRLENNKLWPIYEDLIEQFKQLKLPMKSCFQSLGYTADGVYIDWALDQGALSFAIQIGTNFDGDNNIGSQILFQTEEPFHKILKRNSINYKTFLTNQNQLVVQSYSLINFNVSIYFQDGKLLSTKTLKAGNNLIYQITPEIKVLTLKVDGTIIEERIQLQKLIKVQSIPITVEEKQNSAESFSGIAIVMVLVILVVGFGVGVYFKKKKETEQKQQKFSLPRYSQNQLDQE